MLKDTTLTPTHPMAHMILRDLDDRSLAAMFSFPQENGTCTCTPTHPTMHSGEPTRSRTQDNVAEQKKYYVSPPHITPKNKNTNQLYTE